MSFPMSPCQGIQKCTMSLHRNNKNHNFQPQKFHNKINVTNFPYPRGNNWIQSTCIPPPISLVSPGVNPRGKVGAQTKVCESSNILIFLDKECLIITPRSLNEPSSVSSLLICRCFTRKENCRKTMMASHSQIPSVKTSHQAGNLGHSSGSEIPTVLQLPPNKNLMISQDFSKIMTPLIMFV